MKGPRWKKSIAIIAAAILGTLMGTAAPAGAQNARGSATGPTQDPGYRNRDQFITVEDVPPADNMFPVVKHPEQETQARDRGVVVGYEATEPLERGGGEPATAQLRPMFLY